MEEEKNVKSIVKLISTSTIIASMCCLPSVVLVLFGLASVSSAAALSDTLYWGGEGYEWFRPTMLAIASVDHPEKIFMIQLPKPERTREAFEIIKNGLEKSTHEIEKS